MMNYINYSKNQIRSINKNKQAEVDRTYQKNG